MLLFFSACACSFLWYAMMKLKIVYVLTDFFVFIESELSLYAICNRHYRCPLRGFSTCYVIVVRVIPEKTSLRVGCTNDHSRRQLSTKLAQNLDHSCARRVGNLTILSHYARLLDIEPDKELSNRISLATLTCVELPGIASSLLDNWRNATSPSIDDLVHQHIRANLLDKVKWVQY